MVELWERTRVEHWVVSSAERLVYQKVASMAVPKAEW